MIEIFGRIIEDVQLSEFFHGTIKPSKSNKKKSIVIQDKPTRRNNRSLLQRVLNVKESLILRDNLVLINKSKYANRQCLKYYDN